MKVTCAVGDELFAFVIDAEKAIRRDTLNLPHILIKDAAIDFRERILIGGDPKRPVCLTSAIPVRS
jgi:hypothetical protein